MRTPGVKTIAAAALAAAFASTGTAQAAPACSPVPATYASGGSPLSSFPNDPLFGHEWGLRQIKAPQAWSRGAFGAGATIAVVDSGVDLGHPDLSTQLVPGVDLVSGETCTPGAQDLNGHGTHVAGIAAAATNNGIGVAGTAPLAKIMPVRVLDKDGSGSSDDVVAGIRYAVAHGAQVINLSLGSDVVITDGIGFGLPIDLSGSGQAIEDAYAAGANVVVAAGNSTYPLCSNALTASHAICVAATDSDGFPSSYSNFPVNPSGVAVRAPGGDGSGCGDGDIWSTYWGGASDDTCGPKGYEPLAGTSMATPFVSGVVAMLRAAGLNNAQVNDCLERTSSNGGAYDAINGYGIVSADAAVAGCTQLPVGGNQPPGTGTTGTGTGQQPGTGTQPGQPGGQQAATDSVAPRIKVSIPRSRKAHAARAGYVLVRVRLSEPAKVTLQLFSGRETAVAGRNAIVLARGSLKLPSRVTRSVKLKLTKAGRRMLRTRRIVTVTLLGLARDAAGNSGTAIAEGRIRR
jgi:subtilisin family serine protease